MRPISTNSTRDRSTRAILRSRYRADLEDSLNEDLRENGGSREAEPTRKPLDATAWDELDGLAQDPERLAILEEALSRHLAGTVDGNTWNSVNTTARALGCWRGLYYIAWISYDARVLPEQIRMHTATDRAAAVVRRLTALFGYDLQLAANLWQSRQNHDWRTIEVEVLATIEPDHDRYKVVIDLEKKNLEFMRIETDHDSYVRLLTYFAEGLVLIDREALDSEDYDALVSAVESVGTKRRPPLTDD